VHELEPRAHLVALGDDLVEHPDLARAGGGGRC
jgi:hypothetical protein